MSLLEKAVAKMCGIFCCLSTDETVCDEYLKYLEPLLKNRGPDQIGKAQIDIGGRIFQLEAKKAWAFRLVGLDLPLLIMLKSSLLELIFEKLVPAFF